jgi:hypothetical protein
LTLGTGKQSYVMNWGQSLVEGVEGRDNGDDASKDRLMS